MNTGYISRRRLLKAMGSVAVLGSLNSQLRASTHNVAQFRENLAQIDTGALKQKHVVIIGGGIAGLTAAYELQKAGVRYTVLEASNRVGGRVESVRHGDEIVENDSTQACTFDRGSHLYFNTGPGRISQNHKTVLSYCRELSVPVELIANENPGAFNRTESAFGDTNFRIRNLQASMRGGIAEMLAKSILKGEHQDTVSEAEIPLYLGMLTQFGGLDSEFKFKSSTRVGRQAGSGIVSPEVSEDAVRLSQIVKMDFFSQFKLHLGEYLDQQSSMMQPVGGMDKLVMAFYASVKHNVKTNAVVESIKRSGQGSEVTFAHSGEKQTLAADKVIIAIPAKLAAGIENDFSSNVQASLSQHQMSKATKVAFQSERFWERENGIYGGISYTSDDITLLWYPSNNLGSPQGVLVGGYNLGIFPTDTFGDLSVADRIKLAIEQGEKIHPQYRDRVSNGISRSWAKTPFIGGGWSVVPPDPILFEADGPFVFAGDCFSYMAGWMEGAIGSTHNALAKLVV